MIIVSTREFKDKQNKFFNLAKDEKVLVKKGNNYINLIITDKPDDNFFGKKWLEDFFAIPQEYRCNPFDISPSGDIFWADKRNIEHVENAIKEIKEGKITEIRSKKDLDYFFEDL